MNQFQLLLAPLIPPNPFPLHLPRTNLPDQQTDMKIIIHDPRLHKKAFHILFHTPLQRPLKHDDLYPKHRLNPKLFFQINSTVFPLNHHSLYYIIFVPYLPQFLIIIFPFPLILFNPLPLAQIPNLGLNLEILTSLGALTKVTAC